MEVTDQTQFRKREEMVGNAKPDLVGVRKRKEAVSKGRASQFSPLAKAVMLRNSKLAISCFTNVPSMGGEGYPAVEPCLSKIAIE